MSYLGDFYEQDAKHQTARSMKVNGLSYLDDEIFVRCGPEALPPGRF